MALIVTFSMLRWAASLYRSGIMGLERQVFANAVTTAATTVRLLVPIPLLAAWPDVRLIFATWALVALLEMALFRASLGGEFDARLPLRGFSSEALKSRARFAGGIFFLALVGLAVTQMDKLLLSRMLPLAEYGYYSLVVVIANGVLTLAMPVAQAFQPRMTLAAAQQDDPALRAVVHAFTALMVLAVITPAIVIAAFPKRLLFAWTGDFAAAGAGGDYLGWYVLGAAMAGPTSIAYLIQFAHGRIRLHMIVNLVFALVLIPAIWLAAAADGARGAAIAWFVMNATLLVIYCPAILARLLPGETARWLAELALPASAATLAAIVARTAFGDTPGWRALDFLVPAATGGAALIAAIAASPLGRSTARTLLCRARRRAPS
jgi:O-antigen/teichoic acid export membrane protein